MPGKPQAGEAYLVSGGAKGPTKIIEKLPAKVTHCQAIYLAGISPAITRGHIITNMES